jgi:hypothetical protein
MVRGVFSIGVMRCDLEMTRLIIKLYSMYSSMIRVEELII